MKWISSFTNSLAFLGIGENGTTDGLSSKSAAHASLSENYGVKLLANGSNPIVDIVALHGLDGHWQSTWSTPSGDFWLQDFLPSAIPDARVLSYGYDSRTHGSTPVSQLYLHEHGKALVSRLTNLREETKTSRRPIIFLAHSLGGLVIKSALIHADSAREGHLERHKAFKTSTSGLIFLGTPHQGGNGVALGKILVNVASAIKHTTQNVMKHLEQHSESLQQQQSQYLAISADFDTVCFYETYPMSIPGYGYMLIVPSYSAVIQGQRNVEDIPLDADHRSMTKFGSVDDENYKSVISVLRRMVEKAKQHPDLENVHRERQAFSDSPIKPTSWLPIKRYPQRSSLFIGRKDFLNALKAFFIDRGSKQYLRREYLLYGMGGSGKSQIALAFAETHQQIYDHVFWIDASNRDTLEHSYKNIALQIGTNLNKRSTLEEALQELEFYQGRWLLLFDGADDLEEISGLWPPGIRGDIIYTSRNPMLRRLPEHQMRHVSDMDSDEALRLLFQSARIDASSATYDKQASAIVAELGYLALAVDQAGAYIASGECQIDDFLDTYNAHRQHLLQNEAYRGASENDRAVYATWDLSYAAIARLGDPAANKHMHHGAKAALQILQLFPFFHNEGITEDIFKYAAENSQTESTAECKADDGCSSLLRLHSDGSWESQVFRQGIQILLSFSLIRQDNSQRQIFMHRMVHLWALDRLTANEKELFGNQAQAILAGSIIWRYETSDYNFRRDLLPHISAFWLQTNSIPGINKYKGIAELALVYIEAGRWAEAEKLQIRAMEIERQVLGEEDPKTLSSMSNLALTYRKQGRWTEAENLLIRTIKIKARILGTKHSDTLTSIANLATIYLAQDRWAEAEKLQIGIMETMKRVFGEEHHKTLSHMANLASTYSGQGRWAEAEKLHVQVVETQKRVLGEENPSTMISMANLASLYCNQKRWTEAEKLQIQLITTMKRILGEEHPNTLTVIANLAITYSRQGRWPEAEKLQVQVIDTEKRVLGEEHPSTLISMANLALTLKAQARHEEAISLMTSCFDLRKRRLGLEHSDTQFSQKTLEEWQKQGGANIQSDHSN